MPRLGRVPESDDDASTARAAEPRKQGPARSKKPRQAAPKAAAEGKTAEGKTAMPSLNGNTELVHARALSVDDRGQESTPAPAETESTPERPADQTGDADGQVTSEDEEAQAAGTAATDGEIIAAPIATPKADWPIPPSAPGPVSDALPRPQDVDPKASETVTALSTTLSARVTSAPKTVAPKTVAPKTVAEVEADDNAMRSDEQASPTRATLELDWDRLIASGFADPRDRARPLPRNMDEIIRILIRQALSDQASWRDRVILVTSPNERTSKSTAAINFAFGLTTVGGHHAVLVDVDTLGPGAVDRLGGHDQTGISTALADETIEIDDVVISTDLERLTLVASGPPDEDVLDRFASRRMLQIMRYLTENPETLLIIDAPPVLISQEAAVLSVIAGQVVLAVEAGRSTADQIEHALQRIGERHNVSLVLNESSGVVGEDAPSAASQRAATTANRRAPSARRRLSEVAAAGALALGLLTAEPAGPAGPPGVYRTLDLTASASSQRPSIRPGMPHAPCRQDCW
ncbi:MAG: hypothetical protein OEU92_16320 [Alphaproteobacteria bacterium]|nr:hypothetical protein [Alphaproteobacteria bacterium]